MPVEDIRTYLARNGLSETIEMLHAAAPRSFGTHETEAHDKMMLILRILDMPADSAGTLIKFIEEMAQGDKQLRT